MLAENNGMIVPRTDTTIVMLKPHVLCHVCGKHVHQGEYVPLDLVAVILHQHDTRVHIQEKSAA